MHWGRDDQCHPCFLDRFPAEFYAAWLTDYYREFESDGSTLSLDYVYQRIRWRIGFRCRLAKHLGDQKFPPCQWR